MPIKEFSSLITGIWVYIYIWVYHIHIYMWAYDIWGIHMGIWGVYMGIYIYTYGYMVYVCIPYTHMYIYIYVYMIYEARRFIILNVLNEASLGTATVNLSRVGRTIHD